MSFNEAYATQSPPGKLIMTYVKDIGFMRRRKHKAH